ncbi:winged helix-turn-helix transcriptional regulator [Selenihalanaerobacter shriftii]|uniref:Transcriptional regulator, HxlR family n=1 Tax=Selenihalanaerobacter shriftii TaxID=142842 RepID=A0A1T4PVA5_9FIRM|nr:helix-turn-helix domain-containing protein [Selenihalanaerobacter shriftii]SJZ95480.1 transcriptional regulator, HxlR family [Selenihalanaerobacter shriftii]
MTDKKKVSTEIELTIDIIGGKWKCSIIWLLGTEGVKRFGEIKRFLPEVTHKVLTNQLQELEENNIINRKAYPVVPPKVEYSITDKGETLLPILELMCIWGKDYSEIDYELITQLCKNDKKKNQFKDKLPEVYL